MQLMGLPQTTQDAAEGNDGAAVLMESGDTASSWRFDDGEPIVFSEEEIVVGEGAADASGDEDFGSENLGISLYANTVVPGTGITIPSYVRRPVGATRIGIDVSEHNGRIDWQAVKRAGVEFAIIRCGYGQDYESQHDDRWLDNVRGATAAGIPYGVYLYSYADTVAKAKRGKRAISFACCGRATASPSSPFTTIWRKARSNLQGRCRCWRKWPSRSALK